MIGERASNAARAHRPSHLLASAPLAIALALTATSCAKARPPSGASTDDAREDELASLERELDSQERQLNRAGVRVAARERQRSQRDRTGKVAQRRPSVPASEAEATEPGGGAGYATPPSSDDVDDMVAPESRNQGGDEGDLAEQDGANGGGPAAMPTGETTTASTVASEPDAQFRGGGGTRCDRIRQLASSSCALSDRICGLARAHVGEARFEDACERSQLVCDAAQEATDACE